MANIGYYSMDSGQGMAGMRDDIIAAGHNPIEIFDPSSAQLAGIDALYVWNGDNSGFNAEFLGRMPDITAAVNNGMNMVIFDRATGVANPQLILPGTSLTHVRATTADANLTAAGEADLGNGAGGIITDASLDGGNYTTHGYVNAASLPPGATVLMTLGDNDESKAVGFVYDFGAGSVQYYGIPMDYYNENSQAWENFAINTLEFAAMCLGAGTRVLTYKGYRRVENLRAGQLIWTQDHGFQPLLALVASAAGDGPVVTVPKGVLGNARDLVLSGQHRIYLDGPKLELLTGYDGAFAVVAHIAGLGGITVAPLPNLGFYNLLFAQHEVILADGARVESLYVSPITRNAMGFAARRTLDRKHRMVLAYPELDRWTARAVFGEIAKPATAALHSTAA
ncbi:Hint domain-containing protein [Pseudorhodobacter ferrugineus]|uniref:Hint domain-containing protein n=1 Tax=Pseudorhodobacter ferrugineus TaxID=77008 RepID=UPI0003B6DE41|nr:Hint domain-containing protein [Pseudorhodobacter ferrugineus]